MLNKRNIQSTIEDLTQYNRLTQDGYKVLSEYKHLHHSIVNQPLIALPSTHIIPLPLHIYLGLSNLFLDQCKLLLDSSHHTHFDSILHSIKTHSTTAGVSSIYQLNGPEAARFIEKKCHEKVIELIEKEEDIHRVNTMMRWMDGLHTYLLSKHTFNQEEKQQFTDLVIEIWDKWESITQH